jgi:hypothetical protein
MTYNSEVTYLDTFISLYRTKKRASTNDKEVDLFNFIDKTPIENLHLSFCKYALGIRKKASNLAVRLELGRLPVQNFIESLVLALYLVLYKDIKVSKYVTSELYVIIGLTNVSKRLLATFTGKLFNEVV